MKSKRFSTFHPYSGVIVLFVFLIVVSCSQQSQHEAKDHQPVQSEVVNPEWSINANIYEVNIRQYTPEGTFDAFAAHLPRLKEMGVDILWLMPIHPIGELNRKGALGSYYSIRNYTGINPEFGNLDDFMSFVDEAHNMGFRVILDWVANHTAWDHHWVTEHPDWYTKDESGEMISPYDWSDVVQLNYDVSAVWDAMIDEMKFWVVEANIDGFRCDVAGLVPTPFWERARTELDEVKTVFMLAEAEQADHHYKAFDMSYAWELHHLTNQIAQSEKNANDLESYFLKEDTTFPAAAYRMTFIDNHDENSWNGTIEERLGEAASVFAMLTYTLPGMPLIYSGQEIGLDKRLAFFEKDVIEWDYNSPLIPFYTKLSALKYENHALWNGLHGGSMMRIYSNDDENVFAFIRQRDENKLFVIANLSSDRAEDIIFSGTDHTGKYINYFTGDYLEIGSDPQLQLDPWEFFVLIN